MSEGFNRGALYWFFVKNENMSSKSSIRLRHIRLISLAEMLLVALCFWVGIRWLMIVSMALLVIPLWGLIDHRRWCRIHHEPYENWDFLSAIVAWAIYTGVIVSVYLRFFV